MLSTANDSAAAAASAPRFVSVDDLTLTVSVGGREYKVRLDSDEGAPFYNAWIDQPTVPEAVLELLDDDEDAVQTEIDRLVVAADRDADDSSYVTRHGYRMEVA